MLSRAHRHRSYLAALGFLAAGCFTGPAKPAFADTIWLLDSATPGLFDQDANWSLKVPNPLGGQGTADINNGGTAELLYNKTYSFGDLYISGSSTMEQSAGSITTQLQLQNGTYTLSGTGILALDQDAYMGAPLAADGTTITSIFNITGGTLENRNLRMGVATTSVSYLHITGGTIATNIWASYDGGTGYVLQEGGTVTAGVVLGNGDNHTKGSAFYTLSDGAIQGGVSLWAPTAIFTQTGGSVSTLFSAFTAGNIYNMSGGTMTTNSFIQNAGTIFNYTGGDLTMATTAAISGTFDFGGTATTLRIASSAYIDLSAATIANSQNAAVTAGANAILVFAQGFNPATAFASYNNAGITHFAGTPLVVAAGQTFSPVNLPTSFSDPIDVYGTVLMPLGKGLNISHGLTVHAGAQVDLGTGTIDGNTTDPYLFSGGNLTTTGDVFVQSVFRSTPAVPVVFTQTGGSVNIHNLTLSGGNYVLQGGQLTVNAGALGNGGHAGGSMLQTGGHAYFETITNPGISLSYTLGGGTLEIGTSMTLGNQYVTFDFANGNGVLQIDNGASVNLTGITIANSLNATIEVGVGASIIFPAGFDPLTQLGSYQTGLALLRPGTEPVNVALGETLQIAAVKGHLDVAGTVTPLPSYTASAELGLSIHDGGSVTLNGYANILDSASGITSGTLNAVAMNVGGSSANVFNQSGGTVTLTAGVFLTAGAGYSLTGGVLTEAGTSIGAYDAPLSNGTFTQSGGIHNTGTISLSDYYSTATNTYTLSGTGVLNADALVIEHSGAFIQTGGTASFSTTDYNRTAITIGFYGNALPSSYSISGGSLTATGLSLDALSQFNQTGGDVVFNGNVTVSPFEQTASYNMAAGTLRVHGTFLLTIGGGDDASSAFTLSGGQADIDWLQIAVGAFHWTGGDLHFYSLQIMAPFVPVTWDMGNQVRTVTFDNAFIDLRNAVNITNASGIDMVFGPNTMVLLPSTFNPAIFHSFTNHGVTGIDNNLFVLPAGRTLTLGSSIASLATYSTILPLNIQVSGTLLGYMDPDKPTAIMTAEVQLPTGGVIDLGVGTKTIGTLDGVPFINIPPGGRIILSAGSHLTGGSINAARVAFNGATQTAGSITTSNFSNDVAGGYSLSGTGTIQADSSFFQAGTMTQSGGAFTTGLLAVDAHYNLSGGTLQADNGFVGEYYTNAAFTQTGGTFTVNGQFALGQNDSAVGTLTMSGGNLQTQTLIIGNVGKGIVNANGGTLQVLGAGNALIEANTNPPFTPNTTFTVHGGAVSVPNGTAQIGYQGNAIFNVQSGSFSAKQINLGENGTTTATLSGGAITAATTLYVGPSAGIHSPGENPDTLTITGGTLNAGTLVIGQNGPGSLAFNNASATVNVASALVIGAFAQFSAVPGATIHMTGSDFENQSTDPALLASLNNLTLIFEGGPGVTDTFEVFSTPGSGTGLQSLIIGGGQEGHLELVNLVNNNPLAAQPDTLYVDQLSVGLDSTLELSANTTLYYNQADSLAGDIILDGGAQIVQVPEPASGLLLLLAGAGLFRRRRRAAR